MSSSVPLHKLGSSGETVPCIGLGCMGMSAFYGSSLDEKEIASVLKRAVELGCTFIDTADIYADNEDKLSYFLKDHRKDVFLCTKFAFKPDFSLDGSPAYVKSACDRSLKRLGVDCIDLYYQHRVDPNTPIEETVKAMAELVAEGKVRYLGLSECSAETLRKAHAVHPIAAVQVEYSPWCLDIEENGLLQACRELGVSIVAYSPLGRGFLTGQIKSPDDFAADDFRRGSPRFQGENFQKNLQLVHEFEKLAQKKGCTTGQLVLAWVVAQGEDFIAIPGTKRIKYLEENVGAAHVKLTSAEHDEIRQILKSLPPAGDRYPAAMMSQLGG